MHFIEIIYLLGSVASVIAMAPQIKLLLTTKKSSELHLPTWLVWAFYQPTALAYSIMIGAVPFLVANSIWLVFYTVMVFLIIKYRPKTPTLATQEARGTSHK